MITKEERVQWFRDSLKSVTQQIYKRAGEIIQGDESGIDIWITLEPSGIPEVRITKDYRIVPSMLIMDDLVDKEKSVSNLEWVTNEE